MYGTQVCNSFSYCSINKPISKFWSSPMALSAECLSVKCQEQKSGLGDNIFRFTDHPHSQDLLGKLEIGSRVKRRWKFPRFKDIQIAHLPRYFDLLFWNLHNGLLLAEISTKSIDWKAWSSSAIRMTRHLGAWNAVHVRRLFTESPISNFPDEVLGMRISHFVTCRIFDIYNGIEIGKNKRCCGFMSKTRVNG